MEHSLLTLALPMTRAIMMDTSLEYLNGIKQIPQWVYGPVREIFLSSVEFERSYLPKIPKNYWRVAI